MKSLTYGRTRSHASMDKSWHDTPAFKASYFVLVNHQ